MVFPLDLHTNTRSKLTTVHSHSPIRLANEVREKGKREAVLWHFKDLARANEATEATVSYVDTAFREHMLSALTPESSVTLLHGIQRVAKHRDDVSAANEVLICLCEATLPEHDTEILVTMNTPLRVSEGSSQFGQIQAPLTEEERERRAAQAVEDFKKIASSLKVADFRLFGG